MVGLILPFVGLLAVQIVAVVIYLLEHPITWSDLTSVPLVIRDFLSKIFITETNGNVNLTWVGYVLIITAFINLFIGLFIKILTRKNFK